MKDSILAFLKSNPDKRFDVQALAKALDYTSSEAYKALAKTVNALEDEALILANDKNQYTLIEYTDYVTGVLDVKQKGFAFLKIDDSDDDDIYIPPNKLKNAMNKDRVLVKVLRGKRGLRQEGEVARIITRGTTLVIGTVLSRGKTHFLISDDKQIREDIRIKNGLKGAKNHDKVQAKIINYAFRGTIDVEIVQVIGSMNAPGVDVLSKILKHNIDPAFPEQVTQEAKQYQVITDSDSTGRKDITNVPVVTIDGETAKDFDDAVYVKKQSDGSYHLGVHIADVSHYVKEASNLDKEAYKRGTSIYLVDRVIPMLPEHLSNHLCSLMPGVKRLAVSCDMHLDQNGKLIDHKLYPSIIQSHARMTYTDVNKVLEHDKETTRKYQAHASMFFDMKAVADVLYDRRTRKGSIHFETEEPDITLDEEGFAVDVSVKTRGVAEKLIEEFMLMANQVVAEHVHWLNLPFIYRVHDTPKEEKLEKLLAMARALGFNVKGKYEITHKELQKLLQKVEDTASEKGINLMMLRSMQKAIYSDHNIGHFGLAFDHYTHFTSPIRRYPDLIVHRLLRTYFFNQNQTDETITNNQTLMPEVARHSSTRERLAISLERDVSDMKKAEYMSRHIGKTFKGTISSVTSFGIYVSLKNTVEGLVHISDLDDDYYEFDEERLILTGRTSKRRYRIGDLVSVQVAAVNIQEGEIDFKIRKG